MVEKLKILPDFADKRSTLCSVGNVGLKLVASLNVHK